MSRPKVSAADVSAHLAGVPSQRQPGRNRQFPRVIAPLAHDGAVDPPQRMVTSRSRAATD